MSRLKWFYYRLTVSFRQIFQLLKTVWHDTCTRVHQTYLWNVARFSEFLFVSPRENNQYKFMCIQNTWIELVMTLFIWMPCHRKSSKIKNKTKPVPQHSKSCYFVTLAIFSHSILLLFCQHVKWKWIAAALEFKILPSCFVPSEHL